MVEAMIVEAADHSADFDEQRILERGTACVIIGQVFFRQVLGQRDGLWQTLGDQGGAVGQPVALNAGQDRAWYWQPGLVERCRQTHLAERTGALEPGPDIVVRRQSSNQPATPIGPQHPLMFAGIEKQALSTTGGLANDKALALPVLRVEQLGADLWPVLGVT